MIIIKTSNWQKLLSRSVEEAQALARLSAHQKNIDCLTDFKGRITIDGEAYSTDTLLLLYLEALENACSNALFDFLSSLEDKAAADEMVNEVFLGIAANQHQKTRFLSEYRRTRRQKSAAADKPEVKHLCQYVVEDKLSELGLKVRLNLVTKKIEITGYGSEALYELYSRSNILAVLPSILLDSLRSDDVRGLSQGTRAIEQYIFNIADINRYNPIHEMLEEYENDDEGNLLVLYALLGIEDETDRMLVRKWLMQTVALAYNSVEKQISTEGVLVLQGRQGCGKTSFFRRLSLKPEWFTEGAVIDVRNKDSVISALSTWICELGEIDCTLKREQSALKAFITRPLDRIRFPYAAAESELARATSLCGTVNPDKFLNDSTGSRRYWVVTVEDIDREALFSMSDEEFKYLWGYIYGLYKENPEGFRLSDDERTRLDKRNRNYNCELKYEAEVMELLDFNLPINVWKYVKPAQLASCLSGVTANQVGKILSKLAEDDERINKKKEKYNRLYFLPVKKSLFC